MFDFTASDRCARYLKVVADPDRLQLIHCLQEGPHNVSDLAAALGKRLANVSHHLKILRQSGLVSTRKEGKYVTYTLASEFFPVAKAKKSSGCNLDLGC